MSNQNKINPTDSAVAQDDSNASDNPNNSAVALEDSKARENLAKLLKT